MQNNKYNIPMRIIHWSMSLIIISLLALGFFMTNLLNPEATNRYFIYDLHKSFGVVVFFLIVIRIFTRMLSSVPPLPNSINPFTQKLAHLIHFTLYCLMILMPISGYLMSNYFGYSVHLFGLELPILVAKNIELGQLFAQIHKYSGFSFVAVLILHISGVIKHRFFEKSENDVLKRML
ncbi:MAG: cytochrome b561 [Rickettsiales bacterium]|jgi:cytochrome b561